MPDLFDVLFDIDSHVAVHSFDAILTDYAEGNGVTATQIKNKLINSYGLNVVGETQLDAVLGLIDVETGSSDKVARASFIGKLMTLREGEFIYTTNQSVKTRLGF